MLTMCVPCLNWVHIRGITKNYNTIHYKGNGLPLCNFSRRKNPDMYRLCEKRKNEKILTTCTAERAFFAFLNC